MHRLTRSRDALVHRFRIRDAWRAGSRLTVHADGNPVIGSPIEIQQITRIEGFVREEDGGISGWCWLPGDRDVNPKIVVSSVANALHRMTLRAEQPATEDGPFADFAAPRQFAVTAQDIAAFGGPVVVSGPYGKPLFGSPLNPMGEAESAAAAAARAIARQFPASPAPDGPAVDAIREICIPTGLPGPRPRHPNPEEADRPVIVVIPVHRGLDVTLACLDSVLAARSGPEKVLVIADAPPDHVLVTRLQQLAAAGAFQLDMRPVTKGFPATANVGLRRAATQGCDAVLLNSDTLVAPGWMAALRHAVYGHNTDIGTATPLSNAATIFSYPDARAANPIPNPQDTARFASLAREVNGSAIVDVPTGHGFCLYVRLECLLDTGLLREDAFAQGYGEENDFCMRARHLGWRHVAATGTFVGHAEGQSFGAARTRPHTTAHSIGRVIASGAEYLRGPEFWPRYGGHSDISGTNARMRGSTMVLLTRRPSIPSIIRDQTRGIAYAAHDPPGSQAGTDTGHADPTA